MARVQRMTHPTLGVVSWTEVKEYTRLQRKSGNKLCSWCFGPVPLGCRTRCGKQECDYRIESLSSWSICSKRILRRDKHRCALCAKSGFEVDHIVPVSLGGTDDETNLRTLCTGCHKEETARLRREKAAFIARCTRPFSEIHP